MSVMISAQGVPHVITITKSLGLGLDQTATEAVEKWKFKPAMQNGQAIDYVATVGVNFRLLSAADPVPPQPGVNLQTTTVYDPQTGQYLDLATAVLPPATARRPVEAVASESASASAPSASNIQPPVVISKTMAEFSEEARKAHYQGTVVIHLTVNSKGEPANPKILRSLGLGLDEKAVESVMQWRFRPAMQNGQPIDFDTNVTVNFRLLPVVGQNAPTAPGPAAASHGAAFQVETVYDPAREAYATPAVRSAPRQATATDVIPAKIFSKTEPVYSEEARKAKYQGTVVLYVTVGTDGRVSAVRVLKSLGLGLDEQAIACVKQWVFEPGSKNGQPVVTEATLEVNFRLL